MSLPKRVFTLSIPKPCSQNWNEMQPRDKGRFCSDCQKVVIDFSSFTEQQLHQYLSTAKSIPCGRFHKSQLNTTVFSESIIQPGTWTKIYKRLAAILAFLCMKPSLASTQSTQDTIVQPSNRKNILDTFGRETITGLIKNAEGTALKGAEIKFDNRLVANSDKDGKFEFIIESGSKPSILTFSFPDMITVVRNYHPTMKSASYTITLEKPLALTSFVMGKPVFENAFDPFTITRPIEGLTTDVRQRLADIGLAMRNHPNSEMVLIGYGTTQKETRQAKDLLSAIKNYFMEREGISDKRIHTKVKSKDQGKIETVDIIPKNLNEDLH